jgi:rhodanese-related sulfurtransferase
MPGRDITEVPAAQVPENAYLLDVRENSEWDAGHAPGAVHIPLGTLGERIDEVPKDQKVYVICRSGGRSARATQALNKAGRNAVNVAGGMQDWATGGRTMEADSGTDPHVA